MSFISLMGQIGQPSKRDTSETKVNFFRTKTGFLHDNWKFCSSLVWFSNLKSVQLEMKMEYTGATAALLKHNRQAMWFTKPNQDRKNKEK